MVSINALSVICLVLSCEGIRSLRTETELSVSGSEDWMSAVPNDAPVSILTIPGSHDTLTSYGQMSGSSGNEFAICNSASIPELLEKGIRSLDLRFMGNQYEVFELDKAHLPSVSYWVEKGYFEQVYRDVDAETAGVMEVFESLRLKSGVSVYDVFGDGVKAVDFRPGAVLAHSGTIDGIKDSEGHRIRIKDGTLEEQLQVVANAASIKFSFWSKDQALVGRHGTLVGKDFQVDLLSAMRDVRSFLADHPSEFVMAFVKDETGSGTQATITHQLQFSEFDDLFLQWDSVPTSPEDWGQVPLSQLRGKVVLINSAKQNSWPPGLFKRHFHKAAVYTEPDVLEKNYKQRDGNDKMVKVKDWWKKRMVFSRPGNAKAFGVQLNINPLAWSSFCGSLRTCLDVRTLANSVNSMYGAWLNQRVHQAPGFIAGLTVMDFPTDESGLALINTLIARNPS